MSFPKLRVRISLAESLLLMPGLDAVVNGHAGAKHFDAYPHRHPYDGIDFVASAVHEDRAYDGEMAERFLALRNKVGEIPQSRKIRLNFVDLAIAGFALRLWKSHKPSDTPEESSTVVKRLQKKIERYRRRAVRSAIRKEGQASYQETAERWRRFVAWTRYHLLYFKYTKRWAPYRAERWREQRRQLTLAFATALTGRFFEVPSGVEMVRLVTLATRSLKRRRHPMSLLELLRAPQAHADFLVGFAMKRVALKHLPGAPLSWWQAASDRGEAFRAFLERRAKAALPPSSAKPRETIARSSAPDQSAPTAASQTVKLSGDQKTLTEKGLVRMTEEGLQKSINNWLYRTVTMDFAQGVCNEATSQINRQLLDQYRGETITFLYEGLFERYMSESRPAEFSAHRPTMARQYTAWLLRCLLALRQDPRWINQAIGIAMGRAKEMEDEDRCAECLAAISNGRLRAPIRA